MKKNVLTYNKISMKFGLQVSDVYNIIVKKCAEKTTMTSKKIRKVKLRYELFYILIAACGFYCLKNYI